MSRRVRRPTPEESEQDRAVRVFEASLPPAIVEAAHERHPELNLYGTDLEVPLPLLGPQLTSVEDAFVGQVRYADVDHQLSRRWRP